MKEGQTQLSFHQVGTRLQAREQKKAKKENRKKWDHEKVGHPQCNGKTRKTKRKLGGRQGGGEKT